MPDIATLADLPFYLLGRHPRAELVRQSVGDSFRAYSTREFFEAVRDVSLGLSALGVRPGDRVAIASESRLEWSIADLAILTAGAVSVPIYPTLTASQFRYILLDAGARVVIVADEVQAAKVRQVWRELPTLETLVIFDGARTGNGDSAVLSLAEVSRRGHERLIKEDGIGRLYREQSAAVSPDGLATIIYTSGTTGEPKGVMLSHRNIVSNVEACSEVLPLSFEDMALSFLPLSHSFERTVLYLYFYCGVSVTFAESLDTVGRDLLKVRPTVMTGVPRVYEKLHARVLENVAQAPRLRQRFFRWALDTGRQQLRRRVAGQSVSAWHAWQGRLADRLVLSKVRARTGGRLRFVVSGAAPLPVPVAEFFHAVGIPVLEGYGLTETAPVLSVTRLDTPRLGTVGQAIPGVELTIAADGEILARGPNVMMGYYNKPAETAEAIRDGWFYTGDVGRFAEDGALSITDRKKDLIITSGGKNVAPQKLEARLRSSPLVAEAILVGDRRRFIAALIVPNFTALAALRHERHTSGEDDRAALLRAPETRALYQAHIDATNRALAQHEQVRRFALLPAELSIAGGELTPTMKVKRRVVEERYRDQIDALYQE